MQVDNISAISQELKRVLTMALVLTLVFMALAPLALAHKVNVFAWVEGDTVHVEGYFAGNKKAQDSLVEVFDSTGKKLLDGRTDQQGEFAFKIPKITDLKIVLTASMGHRNDFVIPMSELEEVSPNITTESGGHTVPKPSEQKIVSGQTASAVDLAQMEAVLDKVLDRKLTTLSRLIRETRPEGPTVSEVIGGIGYIFGLMGVALYFISKKKS
jgi:nickel transport protein